jgi:ribosomal protein S18 acetylase RimI-like enzyme
VQCQREGAGLIVARNAGQLIGFGFGLTLPSSKAWWFDLATEVEPGLTDEPPGRTFALLELGVRKPWQRHGVATRLHDLLLEGRPEERATLTVLPTALAAQAAYAKWGWYKVAQKYNPLPDSPLFDVLLKDLGTRESAGT